MRVMIEIDETKLKRWERRREAKLKDIAEEEEIKLLREREAHLEKMNAINSAALDDFMKVMERIQIHLREESEILRMAEHRNQEMKEIIDKIMRHKMCPEVNCER